MANSTTISAHPHLLSLSLLLFSLLLPPLSSSQAQPTELHPDALPLLSFKASADKSNRLSTWNLSSASASSNAVCSSWYGVSCQLSDGRVYKLVLEGLNLSGPIPPSTLSTLSHLRVLSISYNSLSGPISASLLPSNLTSLRLLFLSHNQFSGQLPLFSNSSVSHLYRLDLSYNNLSGPIPAQINRLSHLLTLRLEENKFWGSISGLDIPNLQDFNVSGNDLGGEIPSSLSGFPESSFAGNNPALCGAPLPSCKTVTSDPTRPGSGGSNSPANHGFMVASSPSKAFPSSKPGTGSSHGGSKHHAKLSFAAIILIVLSNILVLALICLLLCWYFLRNFSTSDSKKSSDLATSAAAAEKVVYSNSAYSAGPYQNSYYYGNQQSQNGFERGKLVFFEGARRFELEDLLRASAEMLGKGVFGTAYKAVLDDGSVVAVKRLKLEGGGSGRRGSGGSREFEERMEVLGRLRHPNLVALKAYYFARDEKLLVFDYMPNGSLFWLLHGNRGPGRTPLDWTTRLKIAAGAARGIAFIHSSCKALMLTHGNIKSTNILIDKVGNACVSDFGLAVFGPQTTSSNGSRSSNGYRAPVASDSRKLTPMADVYSFGVLLLELLTGKCPSLVDGTGSYDGVGGGVVDLPRWVQSVVREEWTAEVFDLELMRYRDIEEEMVGLLQIAMACTSASPDQRPKMSQVAKMIEDIRSGGGTGGSPSQDTTSAADSPSVSDETGTVSQ